MLGALILHGSIASFFKGTSVHELGHGTVFRTQWVNKVFLYLFSTISWWDPFDYASSHTFHHRYTLHPEGDRENLLPLSPMVGKTFLLQLLTFNLYTPLGRNFGKGGFLNTIASTVRGAFGKVGDRSRWLLVFHSAVACYSIFSSQWIWFFIISTSAFFTNICSYLVGMTQHCGLKENDSDFRKSVRSITINPFWEFLYWRMNWHTEHHMFAGVPCYNLKALHKEISHDMPKPRTLTQAWREMIDTWKRQQLNPDYFYDTPLPNPTSSTQATPDNDLLHSIGDLAPKGLSEAN